MNHKEQDIKHTDTYINHTATYSGSVVKTKI